MELAVEGAREMNHTYIGTEHLLPGIIRADTSQASSTLEHAGADYAAVRKAVDEVLNRQVQTGTRRNPVHEAKKLAQQGLDLMDRLDGDDLETARAELRKVLESIAALG